MLLQVLAVLLAVAAVALAVATLRGRSQVKACCPAPEHDVRMRGAGERA